MINRIIELEEVVRSTVAILDTEVPHLGLEEWHILKELKKILDPFEYTPRAISKVKQTNVLFHQLIKSIAQVHYKAVVTVYPYLPTTKRKRTQFVLVVFPQLAPETFRTQPDRVRVAALRSPSEERFSSFKRTGLLNSRLIPVPKNQFSSSRPIPQ
ncbi:hypothetical protein JTB14_021182 [Gonioctena quinquepunctata]|nr:hypothetical protein JTB14_021182 [Gonioctena quinquepunctata]